MKQNKIATLIKKADIADKFIDKATQIAESLGYQTDLSYNWGKDTIQTLVISEDLKTVLVLQAIITTSEYNYVRVKDNTGKVLKELSIRADNFDYSVVTPILDFVAETLKQQKTPKQTEPQKPNLTTAEQVYDYGEENNWQNLTNKEYAILAQDVDLARMAVADMQDKEIVVPTILIKFRRNSMDLKQVVMNKIAENKKVKEISKKANKIEPSEIYEKAKAILPKEDIDHHATDLYLRVSPKSTELVNEMKYKDSGMITIFKDNIEGDMWYELPFCYPFIESSQKNNVSKKAGEKESFIDDYPVGTTLQLKDGRECIVKGKTYGSGGVVTDEYITVMFPAEDDHEEDITRDDIEQVLTFARKNTNVSKKATDEDIKLKIQKNKPAGFDTSSPKILEGKAKKVFEDMMNASSDLQEVKADIEKFKAKTDKLIQKKIQKSGLDEKTAKLQDLTNKVAQLMEKAQNVVFQNQDKLGVFVNQTKVVPAKFSDKEKIAKLMEYIDKELGKGRAEQYLKNAENGLQSQATEKAIRELVVFEPTKQQKKTSDIHDEESSIDTLLNTLKTVYTNLRNYYLSMVKTNNVIEEQLLPTVGAAASKKQVVTKKAKTNLVEGKWYRLKGFPLDIQFTGKITEDGKAVFQDNKFRTIEFDENLDFVETNRVPMDEEGFKTLWDWAFTNRAVLRFTLGNMFPEDLTAFSKWMNENKTEDEIKAFNEKMPLDYLMKGSSKKAKMHKKAEYKAEEDVLFEMLEDFEIFTPGEIEVGITVGGRNLETAKAMLFSRTGLRNVEQLKDSLINDGYEEEAVNRYVVGDTEDTEIESKKKVKMVKKASTMVKMELSLANYMDMLQDRAKEIGRQLYMAEELESYFEGVDTVLEPYIFVDNYLINGEFADKDTWQEDYADEYKKYNGDWAEFCSNNAVFYNEDEACLNLGL